MTERPGFTTRYGMQTEHFSELMARQVKEILLIASEFDVFNLEEGGQLVEAVVREYERLDLPVGEAPRFTPVSTTAGALRLLSERKFDLVLTFAHTPEFPVRTIAAEIKRAYPELPIGVLVDHAWLLPEIYELRESRAVDWVFVWQGDVDPLLALVRQVEDRLNVERDVELGGVQVIIFVEDDVRFFSFFLPYLYAEVTRQTNRLMADGLNLTHRMLRMRARPKILLCQTYEEALELHRKFAGNILGVISDVGFPRNGALDPLAGCALARQIRADAADVPIVLQSTEEKNRADAESAQASFVLKSSPTLLEDLRKHLLENFGFGDFVFRMPDRTEVGRASGLRELLASLEILPEDSLTFHVSGNHVSRWLRARTEFALANLLRPAQVHDFPSMAELRAFLIQSLKDYLHHIQQHVTADFRADRFDADVALAKMGTGSLGGKGRGLAFMHKLLAQTSFDEPGLEVRIPQALVLATSIFEEFLQANKLTSIVSDADAMSDQEILDVFRRGRFSPRWTHELGNVLSRIVEPIAVRSSSVLEDSLYQPFSGIYATVMLPNNHPSPDVRLAQLLEAIKVVYASTFMRAARDYVKLTPHRLEQELMAVIVQRIVGRRRGDYFYPMVSGVANSYNFYPFGEMRPEQGVAQLAVGLGKAVVEGYAGLRFCPDHPSVLPQFSTVKDVLRLAQRRFFALDLNRSGVIPDLDYECNLVELEIDQALASEGGASVASTYVAADDVMRPGLLQGGAGLATFGPLLRRTDVSVPRLLGKVLRAVQEGMGMAVEIEFALDPGAGARPTLALHVLQVRPVVIEKLDEEIALEPERFAASVVASDSALGHGRRLTFDDAVIVSPDISRSLTLEAAAAIGRINEALRAQFRNFLLVGPGRWGSRDQWLGIPVTWSQISGARAIVEVDFADLQVEPSQGSHFFHNLTSLGVAYFTVPTGKGRGHVDWEWLFRQQVVREELGGKVRHLRLAPPLRVLVDGRTGRGVVEPAPDAAPAGT